VRRHANQLKPFMDIVKAVISKHPDVLSDGHGELPRRLLARMLTLLTLGLRCGRGTHACCVTASASWQTVCAVMLPGCCETSKRC